MERDPLAGRALASQPTLSRFENAVGWPQLRDMAHGLADTVIEQQRRRLEGRAARITIDLDPTDDPTHGQQEFTFFNGHYDTWCYLPVVATVTFNDEPAQFAAAAVLRPGNVPASRGARGILRRLLTKLRAAFPGATVRVRLDGGFASPKLFTYLEREQVQYVVAMASNARLEKRARPTPGSVSSAIPLLRLATRPSEGSAPRVGRIGLPNSPVDPRSCPLQPPLDPTDIIAAHVHA